MSMQWTGGGECRGEDAAADVVPAHDGALGHAAAGVAADRGVFLAWPRGCAQQEAPSMTGGIGGAFRCG
jgi:hypothetical protein